MTHIVRVRIVPVDVPRDVAAGYFAVLDESERARVDAYRNQRDRHVFTVAHGVLRTLAGRELNVEPAALTWIAGNHGKPTLAPPWSGLHTSLSHSGDMIAAAITSHRPMGVDIQQLLPDQDMIGLSARFFPPEEAEYVAAAGDPGTRADRFAHLWTRKEAVVKAMGSRLWPNLKMAVRDRDVVDCVEPATVLRVADLPAPAGYRAAVALTGMESFVLEAVS